MVPKTRQTCEQVLHNLKMYKNTCQPLHCHHAEMCCHTYCTPVLDVVRLKTMGNIFYIKICILLYIRTIYHTIKKTVRLIKTSGS